MPRPAPRPRELQALRDQSAEIDSWESPFLAVVSVMMLREGWDVRNVTTIVGLRPYQAKSAILPEQTLGRGLRRMFGPGVEEKVSVLGTQAFMDFIEEIKSEGVELERRAMGPGSPPAGPMIVEVDHGDPEKDIAALDIELPRLKPRIARLMKDFEALDAATFPRPRLPLKDYSAAEQRELTFVEPIVTGEVSHTLTLAGADAPDWRHVIGWFAQSIIRDLRMVGGFDVLFGRLKAFVEDGLFDRAVSLEDPNVLRNLSDPGVTQTLKETIKREINRLTVQDAGTTAVQDRIKISATRPQLTRRRDAVEARNSMFNKVAGDNDFELAFAKFLAAAPDVASFFKNTEATGFRLEYQSSGGGIIRDYYPDFILRDDGRGDVDRRDQGPRGRAGRAQVGAAEAVVQGRRRAGRAARLSPAVRTGGGVGRAPQSAANVRRGGKRLSRTMSRAGAADSRAGAGDPAPVCLSRLGDDGRHGADGADARQGFGVSPADGGGGDRRPDHLDGAVAAAGAGGLKSSSTTSSAGCFPSSAAW